MTGYAESVVAPDGVFDADMSLITKPFTMDALTTRVHRMLKSDQAST
jgi:hypothetical protein